MEAVQSQLPRNGDFITGQEAWPTSGEVKWYVLERVKQCLSFATH